MSRVARVSGALAIIAAVLLPAQLAHAVGDSSNITTSPISVTMNVKPGETKSTTLQVQNNGPKAVDIQVEAATFKARGNNGEAAIDAKSNDPSLKWVSFSPNLVHAEPGVWEQVQMTVSLPSDASLGYYYAVLFKPILAVDKTVKNTNTYTPTNAILALIDTGSNNESRSLQIASFTATKKLYEYLPATFNIDVHNNGNIFLPPQGVVYISKDASFKSAIATIPFNNQNGRVLPNSNRVFTVVWRDGFPAFQDKLSNGQPVTAKNGQTIQQLKWDFAHSDKFRFGKYYARLALVYNNGTRDVPIYAVVSFWIIPWKLLLIALGIIALQVFLIVMLLRYRHIVRAARKSQKKASTTKS